MGKCSGLKGGGHHRKALDVAERKRKEKEARKKEQELAGHRAITLQEILTHLDPDCDVYLDAGNENDDGSLSMPDLCRSHFRFEDCSNRRCKFSHEHSIAEALGNVVSGTNSGRIGEDDDSITTIPALRLVPGIVGDRGIGKRKQKGHKRKPSSRRKSSVRDDAGNSTADDPESQSEVLSLQSPFESALLEGSSSVNTIVTYLDSDMDVLHLALSCRHLHNLVMIGDGNGEGCQDVQRRKYRAKEYKLQQRNRALLKNKLVSGRLRYAVTYVESNSSYSGGKISAKTRRKNRKSRDGAEEKKANLRPVLLYDYENPNVYLAFKESRMKSKIGQLAENLNDSTVDSAT